MEIFHGCKMHANRFAILAGCGGQDRLDLVRKGKGRAINQEKFVDNVIMALKCECESWADCTCPALTSSDIPVVVKKTKFAAGYRARKIKQREFPMRVWNLPNRPMVPFPASLRNFRPVSYPFNPIVRRCVAQGAFNVGLDNDTKKYIDQKFSQLFECAKTTEIRMTHDFGFSNSGDPEEQSILGSFSKLPPILLHGVVALVSTFRSDFQIEVVMSQMCHLLIALGLTWGGWGSVKTYCSDLVMYVRSFFVTRVAEGPCDAARAISGLVGIIATIVGLKSEGVARMNNILKGFAGNVRTFGTLGDFVRGVGPILQSTIEKFLGVDKKEFDTLPILQQWIARTDAAATDDGRITLKRIAMVKSLYADKKKVRDAIMGMPLIDTQTRVLRSELFKMFCDNERRVERLMEAVKVAPSTMRAAPLVVLLYGSTGLGKTTLTRKMIAEVYKHHPDYKDELANKFEDLVYMVIPENVYYDAYYHQPAWIIDDFGQHVDTEDGESEFMKVLRLGNNAPYVLHSAKVEDKGLQIAMPEILFLNANSNHWDIKSMTERLAFNRRIDLSIHISGKPQYMTGGDPSTIDWDRVGTDDPYLFDVSIKGVTIRRKATTKNVMQLVVDEFYGKMDRQSKILASEKDMLKAPPVTKPHLVAQGKFEDGDRPKYLAKAYLIARHPRLYKLTREYLNAPLSNYKPDDPWGGTSIRTMGDELPNLQALCDWALCHSDDAEDVELFVLLDEYIGNEDTSLDEGTFASEIDKFEKYLETTPFGKFPTITYHKLCAGIESAYGEISQYLNTYSTSRTLVQRFEDFVQKLKGRLDTTEGKKMRKLAVTLLEILAVVGAFAGAIGGVVTISKHVQSRFHTLADDAGGFVRRREADGDDDFEKYPVSKFTELLKLFRADEPSTRPPVRGSSPVDELINTENRETALSGGSHVGENLKRVANRLVDQIDPNNRLTEGDPSYDSYRKRAMSKRSMRHAEASIDINADELLSAARKNQYLIFLDDSRSIGMNVLFVYDRFFLAPHHFWTNVRRTKTKKIRFLNPVTGVEFVVQACNILTERIKCGNHLRDLGLYYTGKGGPLHKDLRSSFLDEKKVEVFQNHGVLSLLRKVGSQYTPVCLEGNVTGADFLDYEDLATGDRYVLRQGFRYPMTTQYGDCGGMLVIKGNYFRGRICGIHVGGSTEQGAQLQFAEPIIASEIMSAEESIKTQCSLAGNPLKPVIMEDFVAQGALVKINGVEAVTEIQPVPNPTKSKLRPSIIAGVLKETEMGPARLGKWHDDDGPRDPLREGFAKYQTIPHDVDQTQLDYVTGILLASSPISVAPFVLTIDEAVFGSSRSPYIGSLTVSTSPGYPYCLRPEGKSGKKHWIDLDTRFIHEELRNDVAKIVDHARMGKRTPIVFVDTLKDEKRPLAKVKIGKTRVISAANQSFLIAMRMYFGAWIGNELACRITNSSAVGVNPFQEWTQVVRHLQEVGDSYLAGDFKSFDGGVPSGILWSVLDYINAYYRGSADEERVREVLFSHVVNTNHLLRSDVYRTTHGMPSGTMGTANFNTIVNRIYHILAFDALVGGITSFDDNVRLICYGDDVVACVSDNVRDKYNQITISKFFASMGIQYTSDDKKEFTSKWRKLEEVTFLKRRFVWANAATVVRSPLSFDTIAEMLNWVRAGKTPIESARDNAIMAQYELAMHSKSVYNRSIRKIVQICREKNVPFKPMKQDDVITMLTELPTLNVFGVATTELPNLVAQGNVDTPNSDQAQGAHLEGPSLYSDAEQFTNVTQVTAFKDETIPICNADEPLMNAKPLNAPSRAGVDFNQITNIMCRPTRFTTQAWASTEAQGTNIAEFDPLYSMLSPTYMWHNALDKFAFIRTSIRIRVQVNAPPAAAGALVLFFIPSSINDTDTATMSDRTHSPYQYTFGDHTILNICSCPSACFDIPYVMPPNMLHTRNGNDFYTTMPGSFGFFYCKVLEPLTGPTTVMVTIYIEAVEPQLYGPIRPQMVPEKDFPSIMGHVNEPTPNNLRTSMGEVVLSLKTVLRRKTYMGTIKLTPRVGSIKPNSVEIDPWRFITGDEDENGPYADLYSYWSDMYRYFSGGVELVVVPMVDRSPFIQSAYTHDNIATNIGSSMSSNKVAFTLLVKNDLDSRNRNAINKAGLWGNSNCTYVGVQSNEGVYQLKVPFYNINSKCIVQGLQFSSKEDLLSDHSPMSCSSTAPLPILQATIINNIDMLENHNISDARRDYISDQEQSFVVYRGVAEDFHLGFIVPPSPLVIENFPDTSSSLVAQGDFHKEIDEEPTKKPSVTKDQPAAVKHSSVVRSESHLIPRGLFTTGQVSNVLDKFPIIGQVAGAATKAFSVASGVVKALGFSQPLDERLPNVVRQRPASFMQNADGVSHSTVLGMSAVNEVAIAPNHYGRHQDEMLINNVACLLGYCGEREWTTSHTVNYQLFKIPLAAVSLALSSNTDKHRLGTVGSRQVGSRNPKNYFLYPSPIARVGMGFRWWRGGLNFRFMCVKSAFHTGIVRVTYVPFYNEVASGNVKRHAKQPTNIRHDIGPTLNGGDPDHMFNIVWNIHENSVLEFSVPTLYDTDWLSTQGIRSCFGYIVVTVVNTLVVSSGGSNAVRILAFCGATRDSEFAVPCNPRLDVYNNEEHKEMPVAVSYSS
ncbi:hypothetical protein [Beihai echinoderm virus 1]|uniref:hypothetical protein n=1 Tax=Beihai echinoderm virus 1 TaxID=1922379 RepID=UPI00090C0AAA|nr:hypothetical protein [Beihai echinoderm virus 1]APG76811.1 hypothetical protein [Beihai echinoderm virus 1]